MSRVQKFVVISATIVIVAVGAYWLMGGFVRDDRVQTIKIGAILPLTGDLSFVGEGDKKTLMLFANHNPDVEFIYEDSKGSTREGLTAANKLILQGVKYYITSLSYIVNVVQPVLDKEKALNFTLNMDPRTEERSPYTKRLYVTYYDEMDKLVELTKAKKANRIAVLYANVETMHNAVENYLKSRLKTDNIDIYTDSYDLGTKDFRPLLLKIANSQPEIFRIHVLDDKLGVILKQIDELNLFNETTIVSGLETVANDYEQFPPRVLHRFLFTTPKFAFDEQTPIVKEHIKLYGSKPNFDAMFAYDIANLLVPVIRKHGYGNVDEVSKEIDGMDVYTGAATQYRVNKHGGVSPLIYWATIEDGKIQYQ